MRQHKDYDKIINYRDDGDDKWHKRVMSVLNAMSLNSIECEDLYNGRHLYTSKWIQDSGSANNSPKRSSKEAELDASYPEWGIVDTNPPKPEPEVEQQRREDNMNNVIGQAVPSTIPPMCEMEPDTMMTKDIKNDPPPKRVCTVDEYHSKYYGDNPEIVIVKDWCKEEEKMMVLG